MADDVVGGGGKVRCPCCGFFVVKVAYEGKAEMNCANGRCQAALEVTVRSGKPTVTVLATKK
jgi:hypothetical protein